MPLKYESRFKLAKLGRWPLDSMGTFNVICTSTFGQNYC